jgi:hypothetical protein
MTVSINGTSGLTFNDASTQNTAATGFGFKNRLINSDMRIDQRNAGASVATSSGTSVYTIDRWRAIYTQTSKFTVQQNAGSVTPPTGYTNYLGVTSSSAYSITSSDIFRILQYVEGFNTADLGWGTASASPVTLSFWVRSSLTGTFGGSFQNSGDTRSYPFTYTISSANTWEQKSVTIAGDTSGTWLTTNGRGIAVIFGLGVGSTYSGTAGAWASADYISATGATSVVGTNGATFYITGVQLEKGSTATSFDYRPYGTELSLCQRYFVKTNPENASRSGGSWGSLFSTTSAGLTGFLPVVMRVAPTFVQGGTQNNFYINGVNTNATGTGGNFSASVQSYSWEATSISPSGTVGLPISYNGQASLSAEL